MMILREKKNNNNNNNKNVNNFIGQMFSRKLLGFIVNCLYLFV